MPGQDCGLRFAAFDQHSHKIDNQRPVSGTDESREIWWSCSRRSTISFCKLTTSPVVNCGSRIRLPQLTTGEVRSEEHTSELQSHLNLVCRLLLEKKKTRNKLIYKASDQKPFSQ